MAYVEIKLPAGEQQVDIAKLQKGVDLLLRFGEELMSTITDFISTESAWRDRMDNSIAVIEQRLALVEPGIGMTAEEKAGLERLLADSQVRSERLQSAASSSPPVAAPTVAASPTVM